MQTKQPGASSMRHNNRYTETTDAVVTPAEQGGLMIGNLCQEDPNLTVHCIMMQGSWKIRAVSKKGAGTDELEGLARKAIAAWVGNNSRIPNIFEARGIVAHEIAVIAEVLHRNKPLVKDWHCVMIDITGPGVGAYLAFCCQKLMSIAVAEDTVQVHKHCDDQIILSALIAQPIACDCVPRVYSVLTPGTIAKRMVDAA